MSFAVELSRLLGEDAVSVDPVDLLAYAHDASPLSLVAAREGHGAHLPDAVVWPRDARDVVAVVMAARARRIPIIPYGGGSGIVGGALPDRGGVVMDLKRLATIGDVDPISRYVTVGAGVNGQRLEDHLNERGWTTGHYPQSLRSSTVGGWIAHGAVGTASTRYGGIERLVAALEAVLASGEILELRPTPRASVGPDLRMLFVGGEGTLGIVTRATLRIRPLPGVRRWLSFAFPDFATGLDAMRGAIQADLWPTVARLYDQAETQHLLLDPASEPRSLAILACEGDSDEVRRLTIRLTGRLERAGGVALGPEPGERWWAERFGTGRLLRTLQLAGGIADALDVAAPWTSLARLHRDMRDSMLRAIEAAGAQGEVYGHASHFYPDGGNLYLIFRAEARAPASVVELYGSILDAAFEACLRAGASYSHHHGIGLVKAPWFERQQGPVATGVVRAVQRALDPDGLLNPGKLVPIDA